MYLGEDGEDTMTDELADDNASNSGVSEKKINVSINHYYCNYLLLSRDREQSVFLFRINKSVLIIIQER